MDYLITYLFCNVACGVLSIISALKKQRSVVRWFLLTIPFGVIALFVLLALPDPKAPDEETTAGLPPAP